MDDITGTGEHLQHHTYAEVFTNDPSQDVMPCMLYPTMVPCAEDAADEPHCVHVVADDSEGHGVVDSEASSVESSGSVVSDARGGDDESVVTATNTITTDPEAVTSIASAVDAPGDQCPTDVRVASALVGSVTSCDDLSEALPDVGPPVVILATTGREVSERHAAVDGIFSFSDTAETGTSSADGTLMVGDAATEAEWTSSERSSGSDAASDQDPGPEHVAASQSSPDDVTSETVPTQASEVVHVSTEALFMRADLIDRDDAPARIEGMFMPPVASPQVPRTVRTFDWGGVARAMSEATNTGCRWPSGDVRSPDFSFCGKRRSGSTSYCDAHRLLAYTTPVRSNVRLPPRIA